MCGIAGAVRLSGDRPVDQSRVRAASALLAHRGPDGDGIWVSPSEAACLAHRRLAIIDIGTGQQPMLNRAGTRGLVFNGEIYNYLELREELRRRGECFRTNSDTEVLERIVEREGVDGIAHLRGMFAFAAWDDAARILLLARDRVGKKPVYYHEEDGHLYFASSLRALRNTTNHRWELSVEALDSFIALGYIPAPLTIYKNVSKLVAGSVVEFNAGKKTISRYWDLGGDERQFSGSYSQAVDGLNDALTDATRLRLRSDVPIGILLSGGIDSSLIAALASRLTNKSIETFSMGFDDEAFDETEYAGSVAHALGLRNHRFCLRPSLAVLPEMVRQFGEPFADSSALPMWMLSQQMRERVTVALGGDGGDEGFGGYDWYRTASRLSTIAKAVPPVAARLGCEVLDIAPSLTRGLRLGKLRRLLEVLNGSAAHRFASLRSFANEPETHSIYEGELLERRKAGRTPMLKLEAAYNRCVGPDLRKMRYVDMETYLPDDLMVKLDVASMAHSLEIRAPLLDHEVLRFGLALPAGYIYDERGGKRILRDLLARYIPRGLFDRPKQGFSVPLSRWFRTELRPRMLELVKSERLRSLGLLNAGAVHRLLEEDWAGIRDHSQRLFTLLVLDEWLEHHA
jgi:asparagine synthase (glutamine-hydrolysing)